jgi:hypothetical protein
MAAEVILSDVFIQFAVPAEDPAPDIVGVLRADRPGTAGEVHFLAVVYPHRAFAVTNLGDIAHAVRMLAATYCAGNCDGWFASPHGDHDFIPLVALKDGAVDMTVPDAVPSDWARD